MGAKSEVGCVGGAGLMYIALSRMGEPHQDGYDGAYDLGKGKDFAKSDSSTVMVQILSRSCPRSPIRMSLAQCFPCKI